MICSIITPSFRGGEWLKLCIASVADQQGVTVEHIVQDAGSDDGTLDWLARDPRVRAFVEPDAGMYDAVNRGLRRSTGEICAYLNCDEQYLPGALARVAAAFQARPGLEVLFADALVVDTDGRFVCTRPALPPARSRAGLFLGPLNALTAAIFFRRRVFAERGLFLPADWRVVGDAVWVRRLVEARVPWALAGFPAAVFTDTGRNLSWNPRARAEVARLEGLVPAWARAARPAFRVWRWLQKLARGHYAPRPLRYEIYTRASPERRVRFEVANATARWPAKAAGGWRGLGGLPRGQA